MDLFGLKEHEQQHKDMERHIRRLIEQVAQLTIDLGQTRVELRRLTLEVDKKAETDDIDPALLALNEGLGRARAALADAEMAAEEQWDGLSEQLSDALEDLRKQFEGD
jgi:hypothetical protein